MAVKAGAFDVIQPEQSRHGVFESPQESIVPRHVSSVAKA